MSTKTIRITGITAQARGYNRLTFEIIDDKGNVVPVVFPRDRNGDDSLQVEKSIFSVAQAIYFSTTKPEERVATAELYVNNQCCCCTKVHVEGISSLSPVAPTQPATPPPDGQPEGQPNGSGG
ncbi:MAG: hypothetical protein KC501_42195 [Myxococcales bacterium]|nr:hypothetical protein [Myxococcales bacterium]